MLPLESFADVVSFLGYYDLGGLKLANMLLSAVAWQCADVIHLFDFSDYTFYIDHRWIDVYRVDSEGRVSWVCQLKLSTEKNLARFVLDAFRNCTVRRFIFAGLREYALRAVRAVADTIIVAETLNVPVEVFENVQELIEFVDTFRQVKKLTVWHLHRMTLDEVEDVKNYCGQMNIALDH